MRKIFKVIIGIARNTVESGKLFFTLTGILAVFIGYNYLTKKPNISIEKYDPFVVVKMRQFYESIRIRDELKFDKIYSIEKIFKELRVPLRDDCSPEEDRYIVFPLETKFSKNLIQMWNQKTEIVQSGRKHLTTVEMQKNRYEASLSGAGYKKRIYEISADSKWLLENMGHPMAFFSHLRIPAPEKYQKESENYYENVFQYKDNYTEDIFRKALDKVEAISLKTDFLDAFINNRQLWTPFIVENIGNATAKDIQIVFQSGNVSGIHKLIYTNLNHQGVSYFETKHMVKPMYIPDEKNNLLQIPLLKPGEVKIIVVKSEWLIPENEILQIKNYTGEEINRSVIKWVLLIFGVISIVYLGALFIKQKEVETNL